MVAPVPYPDFIVTACRLEHARWKAYANSVTNHGEESDSTFMEKEIKCSETHHDNPTELILNTIAAFSNTPVEELPPLYESLDPDALNQLFQHDSSQAVKLQFQYHNFEITLDSDGVATFEEVNQ